MFESVNFAQINVQVCHTFRVIWPCSLVKLLSLDFCHLTPVVVWFISSLSGLVIFVSSHCCLYLVLIYTLCQNINLSMSFISKLVTWCPSRLVTWCLLGNLSLPISGTFVVWVCAIILILAKYFMFIISHMKPSHSLIFVMLLFSAVRLCVHSFFYVIYFMHLISFVQVLQHLLSPFPSISITITYFLSHLSHLWPNVDTWYLFFELFLPFLSSNMLLLTSLVTFDCLFLFTSCEYPTVQLWLLLPVFFTSECAHVIAC